MQESMKTGPADDLKSWKLSALGLWPMWTKTSVPNGFSGIQDHDQDGEGYSLHPTASALNLASR